MSLEHKLTHEPEALFKLPPSMWGKPRIACFLIVLMEGIQALEDAIWTYLDGIDVDTCERYALEGLAAIVGEDARPVSTDALRTYVKARIAVNRSDGTPDALADVIRALTDGTIAMLTVGEEVRVLQITGSVPDYDVAAEMLAEAREAGDQSCWLSGAGAGSFALPAYGDTSPDLTRRLGVGTWSNRHG